MTNSFPKLVINIKPHTEETVITVDGQSSILLRHTEFKLLIMTEP